MGVRVCTFWGGKGWIYEGAREAEREWRFRGAEGRGLIKYKI